jgi:hypothetical protein
LTSSPLAAGFVDDPNITSPAAIEVDPYHTTTVVFAVFKTLDSVFGRVRWSNIDAASLDVGAHRDG